ncbi:hypothetical protein [Algibacter sp. 2305UL17-15]|uniref:hypothetical protein n=1 Tax=Algibacter sp. 2305UL17-15 TaxID=3231268 RepID=UPI003458810A
MRFLIISVFFILLFPSCGIPTIKGLPEYNSTLTEFSNPYFSDINIDYVYKAKINAYDHVFGGMLIIKKIKNDNHRIVFTTNFGNKIFDFELLNGDLKTHYIMEKLNRNIIINTLKHDFETLTQEHNKIHRAFKKEQQYLMYQSKTKNRYNHYIILDATRELAEIIHTSKTKEKIIIKFDDIQDSIATSISIQHKKSPIKIELDFLNNN